MGAKDIIIKPIKSRDANEICKRFHYSGKVVPNSQIHLGVFYNGKCEGVMQFGPSTFKKKLCNLVENCKMNEFIELNRMAFSDILPRNSESRAISIAIKIIKNNYKHLKFIVSFADGCQCGDGTIYRASGFKLTSIKKNSGLVRNRITNEVFSQVTLTKGKHILKNGKASIDKNGEYEVLQGYQFRYIYLLNKSLKLNCSEIKFDKIPESVKMYKGIKRTKHESNVPGYQSGEGEAVSTSTLQLKGSRDV